MHFIAHLSWTGFFLYIIFVILLQRYMERRVYGIFFCVLQFFCCPIVLYIVLWFYFKKKEKTKSFVVQIFYISYPWDIPVWQNTDGFYWFIFVVYFLQCNQQNILVCVTIVIFLFLMKSCWLNFNFIYFYCSCGFK